MLIDSLEKGKPYFKIGYPQHCTDHNPRASHCISYALSDKLNHNLTREVLCWVDEHDSICELCNNIFSTTDKITDFIKESDIPNKPDLLYDTKNANGLVILFAMFNKTKQNWMLCIMDQGLLPKCTSNAI